MRHVGPSEMRGAERGLALGYMKATDPQVLGEPTIRLFSSCIECLVPSCHGSDHDIEVRGHVTCAT